MARHPKYEKLGHRYDRRRNPDYGNDVTRNERVKRWRAAKHKLGICTVCPNKADRNREGKFYSRCRDCRKAQSDARQIETMPIRSLNDVLEQYRR